MNKLLASSLAALLLLPLAVPSPAALASDKIRHEQRSVRSTSMGGLKYSTGLYEENFFGNPARAAANPEGRFELLPITVEANKEGLGLPGKFSGEGSDIFKRLGDTVGSNNHARVQTSIFAFYLPTTEERVWSLSAGLFLSVQADIDIRRAYMVDLPALADFGPAVTYTHPFLEDDALELGVTAHLGYRLSTVDRVALSEFLRGQGTSIGSLGRDGVMLDFDVGATYDLPWEPAEGVSLQGAVAIRRVLGGRFNQMPGLTPDLPNSPAEQPRTLNLGISAEKDSVGAFGTTSVGFEVQDIGGNPGGSLFRTLHLGGESHFGLMALRAGLFQGYLSGGLGFDFRFFRIDLGTYGEELTLNAGGGQDRIYALRLGFEI